MQPVKLLFLKTKLFLGTEVFDSNETQVWGAEKGGYIFNKLD